MGGKDKVGKKLVEPNLDPLVGSLELHIVEGEKGGLGSSPDIRCRLREGDPISSIVPLREVV